MSELWWLWALCSSVINGIMIYANQIFKMPSSLMMTYRGIIQGVLLLPFFPLFVMPEDPWFWLLGIVQGFIVAYSDKQVFRCSRRYGGELVGAVKPYIIAMVFVLWLIIKPGQLILMWHEPLRFGLIILCMLGIMYSLHALCNVNSGREAFVAMLPALLAASVVDINNKYITTLGAISGLPAAIFYYCWITAIVSGLPNMVRFFKKRDARLIIKPRYIAGGMLVIFCSLSGNIFKNTAMFYAHNPAYVSAVMSLYPVWIILWNNFYYRKEGVEKFPRCNFWIIALMLASVISLILLQ